MCGLLCACVFVCMNSCTVYVRMCVNWCLVGVRSLLWDLLAMLGIIGMGNPCN